jgi:AbrB family looped-hinge helix DNA binding protein
MDGRCKMDYLTRMATGTTRVSSRGQVVIPAEVRRQLQISTGDELTVEVGEPPDRAIVLRVRSAAEVDRLLEKGWAWLRTQGYDPVKALHAARARERSRERRRRP